MPVIHLIATVEAARVDWIPPFALHYRSLGVDRLHVAVNVAPGVGAGERERIMRPAMRLAASCGVEPPEEFVAEFDAIALRARHDRVQFSRCRPDDWVVWADIDEFHEFAAPLPEMIESWGRAGVYLAFGRFLDRVAEGGALPAFRPDAPIWDQFPLGADVTEQIALGRTRKVVCARASVRITRGNHDPGEGQNLVSAEDQALIHHFKWDQSVIERLRPRLREEWKSRCPWWEQSARILDHLERHGGRIELSDLSVTRPRYRGVEAIQALRAGVQ